LRGLHYQTAPHGEGKLIRCTRGSVYDVAVDLRPDSPTYCEWSAVELSADACRELYLPPGLAHGFQTLAANSELLYHMTEPYHASSAAGVRWDDAAFGVRWPDADDRYLSERDANFPSYAPARRSD
jgi:dTDP-4-dehydrorhamnose 3,5-epimerase